MNNIKLVLMSCCAPCAAGAIKQLSDNLIPDISDFIVLFYNPNIYPDTEYLKRLSEQIKYCESLGVKYAIGDYDHSNWLLSVKGLEKEPERGLRCAKCFEHRFDFAQKFAKENGYNAITSVFGVSRHKNQDQVDKSANVIKDTLYISINFDENIKNEMNKESNFYRQNYCGCEFSIRK